MEEKVKNDTSNLIESELNKYVCRLQGLNNVLPLSTFITSSYGKKKMKDFNKYIQIHGIKGKDKSYTIEPPYIPRVKQLKNDIDRNRQAVVLIPQSFFVTLVSTYDAYLGTLIKILLTHDSKKLLHCKRTFCVSDLDKFSDVQEAKNFILEKEIESLLRKNHIKHFEWMEKTFDIKLREDLNIWPKFVEFTERRNLFVHCDGIVSSQYIQNCRDNKVVLNTDLKVGDKLNVDSKYFSEAYECFFEIGVKLTHVLWRKIIPENLEIEDKNLSNDICYSLLENSEYELAKTMLNFATDTLKKHFDDIVRRQNIINKAIVYKWTNNNEESQKILNKEDWTATNDQFQLAVYILKDDYKNASLIMKKIGKNEKMEESHYLNWPLFKEFKKTEIFANTYRDIYGQSFCDVEKEYSRIDN